MEEFSQTTPIVLREKESAPSVDSGEHTLGSMRKFAILMPLTSRGGSERLRLGLIRFLDSFDDTAGVVGGRHAGRWSFEFHAGVDTGDSVLDPNAPGAWDLHAMFAERLGDLDWSLSVHRFDLPPGQICTIWRHLAGVAYARGADLFVLLGDDIVLKTVGWPDALWEHFERIQASTGLPFGFGCVSFHDASFPGFPTFPVLHRRHFEVFAGDIFPSEFVNQDADPFLFQIYRRWNASVMAGNAVLTNEIGGAEAPRYTKEHVAWNGRLLGSAVEQAAEWLGRIGVKVSQVIALDIVMPSYRANPRLIEGILGVRVPSGVSTMFIVIFDHPESPEARRLLQELEARHAADPMIRLRMQESNLGASAARNRGLDESSADWVLFLDDDVVPEPDILERYAAAIRANPRATGFVGTSRLPPPRTSTQAAVHIANISYFWTIARGLPQETELPWGVTANLLVRRELGVRTRFRTSFPKTGGGEDIDFCLRARSLHAELDPMGTGWVAAPDALVHHPWWDDGRCSYHHFFGWSRGDGQLIDLFRRTHCYLNLPDLAETVLLLAVVALAQGIGWGILTLLSTPEQGTVVHLLSHFASVKGLGITTAMVVGCILGDVVFETCSWFMSGALGRPLPELAGVPWRIRLVGLLEGLVIRTWSQVGRLYGHWERGRFWGNFCRRFRWFGSMWPGHVRVERQREAALWLVRLGMIWLVIGLKP